VLSNLPDYDKTLSGHFRHFARPDTEIVLHGRNLAAYQTRYTRRASKTLSKNEAAMSGSVMGKGFDGQVCLVTGAAGAIGAAVAEDFAREGASLILVDREAPLALAEQLATNGTATVAFGADVTVEDEIRAAVKSAVERFGRIDVLVNVAGVVSHGAAEDVTVAEWDRVLNINIRGTFLFCRAVMPIMRRQRYGRIVNLGSVVGQNGGNPRPWLDREEMRRAGNVAYGVSKAGVHALTAYLAKDLAADGVTVNAVAPGPIATSMTINLPPALTQLIPVGRMGTAAEVAHAILYLASPRASYVTGEILDVNGGLTVG
jgi:NAD(P)-dependent dehydrogenase (short-subunit alcohol dehydrogenase family)